MLLQLEIVFQGDGNNKFTLSDIFVGGIPRDKEPITDAKVTRGFEGCVHMVCEIELIS